MSPKEFEHALAFLCQRDGCRDVRVVGGSGDLGADVIATVPDGRRLILQAKRYGPNSTVGSGDVQKVNGTYQHAHGGHLAAIVTTSRFTQSARDYAVRVGIRLLDGDALAGWTSRTGPAPWH
ncbi:restriction endonuclease [Streptomyces sp. CBMA29]|uniref:restriction endonuclease n=1 Tax=Streptomyces sp. CBMA29 TaxID=1896314 RepID=UPI0021D3F3A1|nr:restriction endonuclease [Streptomyces sp. CBMA29]